jgi:integrase
MKAKLTKRLVDTLKPKSKAYAVWDTDLTGFLLRVAPTGRMTWLYSYRNAEGRRLSFKCGNYPGTSPDGARQNATTAAGTVASNRDPQGERKAARIEAERTKVSTLGAFITSKYEKWAKEHLRRGDIAVARLKADFEKWLEQPLNSFNAWRLESWRRDRLAAGIKPTTLNRQLDTLRAALRKAVDWEVLDKHPMQGFKRLKVDEDERVRFMAPEEEKRLRNALVKREDNLRAARERFNEWRKKRKHKVLPLRPAGYVDHIRPLVLLALNTGLRRGELFSLKWGDISFTSKMLTVRAAASKSGDSRRVPLNVEAETTLKAWHTRQKPEATDYVFPGEAGARLTNMNKAWDTVCDFAKVKDFRLHDCRHHFASMLVQKGVDLYQVKELLGHHSIEMTQRYAHLAPGNLAAAVQKLAQ